MSSELAATFSGTSLIDAHVHFHAIFDRAKFLTAAAKNFAKAARELGIRQPHLGWLLFTESHGKNHFTDFRRAVNENDIPDWSIQGTAESCSLIAKDETGNCLVLVAGRQIVTAEGLEVLALGLEEDYCDGGSLAETLREITAHGTIPVLPWGFGKWWLRRGQILHVLLRRDENITFHLGDNGGRPRIFTEPRAFRIARKKGILVLPGSDPLPLPSAIRNAGSCGFRIDTAIDLARPFECLKDVLGRSGQQPATFGLGISLLQFLRDQINLRLNKSRLSQAIRQSPSEAKSPN